MSVSASPPKKRRLSTSPADERRVSINEPLKKIKQENSNGSGSPGSNTVKPESSPKMTSVTTQQSKTSSPTVRVPGISSGATHSLSQTSASSIPAFSSDIEKERESVPAIQPSISSAKGKVSNTQAHPQSSSASTSASVSTSQQGQTQSQIQETQLSQQSPQELMIRLAKKEEEIQNLLGELHNLSQTLTPDFSFDQSLRKKFLDPAINSLFRTMKKELEDKEKIIENLQCELAGVGFTPNSITGKKLVTKLKDLQDENEELGRQLRQGRVEQYEVEIALQRKLINELRHGLEDYENQSIAFDTEIERLQDLIFQLRSKLKHYENKFGPLALVNKEHTTAADASKSDVIAGEETEPADIGSKRDLITQGADKG